MDDAFAKLARAKFHSAALWEDVQAFRERRPHEWDFYVDEHPTDRSLAIVRVVAVVREQTPSHWGLIVGDVLTNLRASLDHAIFGHATARRKLAEAEERRLQFPILLEPDQWLGAPAIQVTATTPGRPKVESAYRKLAPLIDQNVLTVIEQSQPYHFMPTGEHPLAVLKSLVNEDKHRAVRVVSCVSTKLRVKRPTWFEVVGLLVEPGEITDGMVGARITIRKPKPPKPGAEWSDGRYFETLHSTDENIELPPPGLQKPAVEVMDDCVEYVERLLNQLQAAGC